MKNLFILVMFIFSVNTFAVTTSEQMTENYFKNIKNNPEKLAYFLHEMPKGGDLHIHSYGATMAENMLRYAKGDHLCVNLSYNTEIKLHCDYKNNLDNLGANSSLYHHLINAWSMQNFKPLHESGHDHFFATFDKYFLIADHHRGEILTEIVQRAGLQNEIYLELLDTPDHNASGEFAKSIRFNANLAELRLKLLNNGLKNSIAAIPKQLDHDEKIVNSSLHCGTNQAEVGCDVKVRYLYQVLREQPPQQVFAQLLTGFEIASQDPRIVGINMVQAEDGKIALRDYDLHMQMVKFLHHLYPQVKISLHAGELIEGLVSPHDLTFHIQHAINIAHADRIGHGVDIIHENQWQDLLRTMAKKHILVEINLVSNDAILGVTAKTHPLLLYMHYGVPVALSTDDEGVLRTNLTEQYQKAVLDYHFSYLTLKNLARNSLAYSFLPGKTLWNDDQYQRVTDACAHDELGSEQVSLGCDKFLKANEKANLQWELEREFNDFEKKLLK